MIRLVSLDGMTTRPTKKTLPRLRESLLLSSPLSLLSLCSCASSVFAPVWLLTSWTRRKKLASFVQWASQRSVFRVCTSMRHSFWFLQAPYSGAWSALSLDSQSWFRDKPSQTFQFHSTSHGINSSSLFAQPLYAHSLLPTFQLVASSRETSLLSLGLCDQIKE